MNDDLFDFSQKHPDPETEKPKLRYNREERLKHAPENVKKLHAGEYTKKRGLIKALFVSPGSSGLALIIVLMLAFIAIYSRYTSIKNYKDFSAELACSRDEKKSTAQDGNAAQIFASVTITPKTQNFSDETVTVLFFAVGKNDIVLSHTQVASVYLAEPLALSSVLEITGNIADVKKIKAQIQLAEKIMILEKKL